MNLDAWKYLFKMIRIFKLKPSDNNYIINTKLHFNVYHHFRGIKEIHIYFKDKMIDHFMIWKNPNKFKKGNRRGKFHNCL